METEQKALLINIIVKLIILSFVIIPFIYLNAKAGNVNKILIFIGVYIVLFILLTLYYKQKRIEKSEIHTNIFEVGSMFGFGFLILGILFLITSAKEFLEKSLFSSYSLIVQLGVIFLILGIILLYLGKRESRIINLFHRRKGGLITLITGIIIMIAVFFLNSQYGSRFSYRVTGAGFIIVGLLQLIGIKNKSLIYIIGYFFIVLFVLLILLIFWTILNLLLK